MRSFFAGPGDRDRDRLGAAAAGAAASWSLGDASLDAEVLDPLGEDGVVVVRVTLDGATFGDNVGGEQPDRAVGQPLRHAISDVLRACNGANGGKKAGKVSEGL